MTVARLVFIFSILFISNHLFSQSNDLQLAQQYYAKGEFDKAVTYYEKVYKKDGSYTVFTRYFDCLNKIGDTKTAEKVIKKQIKADPAKLSYQFQYAEFLEVNKRNKESEQIYQDLINTKGTNTLYIKDLYNSFKDINRLDLAGQTLDKARKYFKNAYPLYQEFAQLYYLKKDYEKAIDEVLTNLINLPNQADVIKTTISDWMTENEDNNAFQETLKNKIIKSIQKNNDNYDLSDLLIWYFAQRRQFDIALTQVKALDKREKGQGKRVYNLGIICLQNKDYKTANEAFEYVASMTESYLANDAKRAILTVRYYQITKEKEYNPEILASTIEAYNIAISKNKDARLNFQNIIELAEIEAYYANHPKRAIELLSSLKDAPGLTDIQRAQAKMLLADIEVLMGDIWESSLLYMQIDRDFKFEPIGFEAKYKNARIFYYSGDFKFAQSQLDVLKKSTTKLIANDAMKLSILIQDNFGLDSNFQAMRMFASADLLLEQHLYDKAFKVYDSIVKEYPQSGLMDEIALRKARAMMDQGKWDNAILYLNEITQYHAFDILIDDALYYLGVIYQEHKNDPEKAMDNFKKLLMDHPSSLYNIEVRERMRKIRGES